MRQHAATVRWASKPVASVRWAPKLVASSSRAARQPAGEPDASRPAGPLDWLLGVEELANSSARPLGAPLIQEQLLNISTRLPLARGVFTSANGGCCRPAARLVGACAWPPGEASVFVTGLGSDMAIILYGILRYVFLASASLYAYDFLKSTPSCEKPPLQCVSACALAICRDCAVAFCCRQNSRWTLGI